MVIPVLEVLVYIQVSLFWKLDDKKNGKRNLKKERNLHVIFQMADGDDNVTQQC